MVKAVSINLRKKTRIWSFLIFKCPVWTVLKVLRQMKMLNPAVPVILSSAYQGFKRDLGTWASDEYVVKSGNLDDLKSTVRRLWKKLRSILPWPICSCLPFGCIPRKAGYCGLHRMKDIQSQRDSRKNQHQESRRQDHFLPDQLCRWQGAKKTTYRGHGEYVCPICRTSFKGTHMSRFVEILNEFSWGNWCKKLSTWSLEKMKDRLEAEASHLESTFPYFLHKARNGWKRTPGALSLSDAWFPGKKTIDLKPQCWGADQSALLPDKTPHRLPGSLGRWGKAESELAISSVLLDWTI